MDDDWKVVVAVIGFIFAGLVLIFVLTAISDYLYESRVSCPAFGAATGRPVRYSFWAGGCFVEAPNGQWVHTDNYWNGTQPSGGMLSARAIEQMATKEAPRGLA